MTIEKGFAAGLLAVALAGAAAAQDGTAPDTTPPEATAEETPAAPAEEAPSGESAADVAEVEQALEEGQVYVAEEFGDWDFACVRTGTGNDPCRFTQTLENGEGGRVAQVSVVPLPPGEPVAAAAIIETPLGTLLRVPRNAEELTQPGGLRIRVDDGEIRVFQFTFCNSGGCVAEIGMEQSFVDDFKRGRAATLTIWSADAPGQPVELPLSLTGFTSGFNRVAELAQSGDGEQ